MNIDAFLFGSGIIEARKKDALLRNSEKRPILDSIRANTPEEEWELSVAKGFINEELVYRKYEAPKGLVVSAKGKHFLAKGGYAGEIRRARSWWLKGAAAVTSKAG